MLSILIPCYNFDVVPLVKSLHKQALECDIVFEILVYDDASKIVFENNEINNKSHCTYTVLANNIGRSKIRNTLGKNAKFENLLFIDAGTLPKHNTFIKNYINTIEKSIVIGHMIPEEKAPKSPYKLRWLYTKKRESKTECSSNFMIKKRLFLNTLFDETLKGYGYEDVLFFNNIKKKNLEITYLNNPVIHIGDDCADDYIIKTEAGIRNLKLLIDNQKISKRESKIYNYYTFTSKFGLNRFIHYFFKTYKKFMLRNFNSSNPSLLLFDFYRLGYFCTLNIKK